MPDTITLSNVNQLPPGRLATPHYNETPAQAAVRCAQKWGVPVAVYVVRCGGPGAVFVGEREGE